MRERFDDTGPEPGFCLGKDAVRPANAVVGDRDLPIRPCGIIPDRYLTGTLVAGKCMLQRIHDELRDDQADALGVTGRCSSRVAACL
jgi:hypothetical protein